MQHKIHPKYETIAVTCSCGNSFETGSTIGKSLQIEVCSKCHPFYTGQQKKMESGGRIERFMNKYKKKPDNQTAD